MRTSLNRTDVLDRVMRNERYTAELMRTWLSFSDLPTTQYAVNAVLKTGDPRKIAKYALMDMEDCEIKQMFRGY